ncbi:MAG: transcriptional regulator, HxlR family [Hydrocarboniphaga sp.]|uniref:winged helix-turn-helix transcriptional regulator n=1 Tax=Hydrocarboniphaga sp. TaxID=2033016 RepID=UPI0026377B64|nr:helix-turn-helix domain-containing protein [Hydrocarboniphaga sp.]MDB5972281.1 transcriptional regulator, HxlR family [Hydrocarboniphaga sp.]
MNVKTSSPKIPRKPLSASVARPINELLDLVGQRWTLRILWELRDGPSTFRGLQLRCGNLSPTVLNKRVQALRDADIVELTTSGYALTTLGLELGIKLLDLTKWAERWSRKRAV